MRMLASIGSVLRVETAWLTVERPLAKSCCLQLIFTVNVSYKAAAGATPRRSQACQRAPGSPAQAW
jgi:hypothetical protein